MNYKIKPNSCDTKCSDGSNVSLTKYDIVTLWDSNDDMAATILNVKSHIYNYGPVIAVLKHSASVASYSGSEANGIFVNSPTD